MLPLPVSTLEPLSSFIKASVDDIRSCAGCSSRRLRRRLLVALLFCLTNLRNNNSVLEQKPTDDGKSNKHPSVVDPLINSNSSEYSWTGNHFIPPNGVPTFSPTDFLSYFSKRNTLFIGDSTGRRAYGSLFGIMTSNDQYNIAVASLDAHHIIDFNKKHRVTERCRTPERILLNQTEFVCRSLASSTQPGLIMNDDTGDVQEKDRRSHVGKFDFMPGNCISHIYDVFTNQATREALRKDYDLIVITAGIWDVIRGWDCVMTAPPPSQPVKLSTLEKCDVILDTLSAASSADLQVVFRTPGFSQDHSGDHKIWEIINRAKDYPARLPERNDGGNQIDQQPISTNTNFTVVDWGTVISKRSFGNERIAGDIKPHYGLEARLLFLQQLLHELLASAARGDDIYRPHTPAGSRGQ